MKSPPTTDRGRATVERIVGVACELFFRHGVRGTSLDDIFEASGTGRGQLYHFFEDKSDLVRTVVDRQVENVLVAQQPELGEIADAAGLRAWADRLVVLHEEEDDPIRCPVGALVMEMAEDDPDVRAALDAGLTRWRDAIAASLLRLQDAGEIPPSADATELAEVLLAAYQGGVLLAQAHASSASLRLALETTVEGILAAPSPGPQARCSL